MSTEMVSLLNRQSGQSPVNMASEIQMVLPPVANSDAPMPEFIVVDVPNLGSKPEAVAKPNMITDDKPEIVFAKGNAESPPAPASTTPHDHGVRAPKSKQKFHEKQENAKRRENNKQEEPKAAEPVRERSPELESIANSMMSMLKRQITVPKPHSPNFVSEKADPDWNEKKTETITTDRPKDKSELDRRTSDVGITSDLKIDREAIEKITDQIVQRYPKGTTCFIGFAGSEGNPHTEQTCALVAQELAKRHLGQVLLIDGDFEESGLTSASDKSTSEGFKNLLMQSSSKIEPMLCHANQLPMDFLPAGTVNIKYWLRAKKRTNELFERISSAYRFVCVAMGDSHSRSSQMLASCCSGMYLVVSMTKSSRVVVQSATQQLHDSGANIMGCIVSDCPTTTSHTV